jgi:predicted PurR-regulated permease PerM
MSGGQQGVRTLGDGSTRSVALATLALIAVAGCVALLVQLSTVVVAALIAIVIGSGIAPLVRRVERGGLDRTAAALIVYIVLLSTLLGLSLLVLPRVIESASSFVRRLPEYYVGIRQLLERSPSQVVHGIALAMPERLAMHVAHTNDGPVLNRVVSLAGGIGHGLFVAAGGLVLVFYWLVYGDAVLATAWHSIPPRKRTGFGPFIDQVLDKLGAFIRGQLLISVLIGLASFLAFSAIGLPQADILGVLAGCLEGLPVVGPLLSMFAASLIALATQPSRVLWVIAAALAIQASESYLVWPRIMGRAVGVDPAICLVALAVFSSIWGVAGAFLSVPITVVGQLFYRHMKARRSAPVPVPSEESLAFAHTEALWLADQAQRLEREADPALAAIAHDLRGVVSDLDDVVARAQAGLPRA